MSIKESNDNLHLENKNIDEAFSKVERMDNGSIIVKAGDSLRGGDEDYLRFTEKPIKFIQNDGSGAAVEIDKENAFNIIDTKSNIEVRSFEDYILITKF